MCEFCWESWSEETVVIGFTCEFISEALKPPGPADTLGLRPRGRGRPDRGRA
jgi:hypothetical protein